MAVIADAVLDRWLTPAAEPAAAAALRALLLATPPVGYAGAAEAIAAAALTETTHRLRVPTLVLVGEHDEATPLAAAEALRDAIPNARLEVLRSAAHIPTVEQPAAVTEALASFLATLPQETVHA
jgi:pimeloyl-ACP methyl ester carboxylesterase